MHWYGEIIINVCFIARIIRLSLNSDHNFKEDLLCVTINNYFVIDIIIMICVYAELNTVYGN